MAAPTGQERKPGVFFRHLETHEEYLAVEEIQRDAWGLGTVPPVPSTLQKAIQANGGLLLGAFVGPRLVGYTMGFLGREGESLFHFSHQTAVRRAEQDRHLGTELKLYQREEVLAQGLSEIRWTFDPLQSKNASLNVRRLGGRPLRYYPNYYGAMGDAINAGLESDRLLLVWSIVSAEVKERILRGPPSPDRDAARLASSLPLCHTAVRPDGPRVPVSARAPEGPEVNIEIPYDLARVRERDPGATARWRAVTREAFQEAFRRGYEVHDFATLTVEGEKRSFYFLSAGSAKHAT